MIKHYPLSCLITLPVLFLPFFRPSQTSTVDIPYLDKIVHTVMYMGLSLVLWLEFLRAHKREVSMPYAWLIACAGPIALGGVVELGQQHLTTYRGGDWWDFIADITGAVVISIIITLIVRRKR